MFVKIFNNFNYLKVICNLKNRKISSFQIKNAFVINDHKCSHWVNRSWWHCKTMWRRKSYQNSSAFYTIFDWKNSTYFLANFAYSKIRFFKNAFYSFLLQLFSIKCTHCFLQHQWYCVKVATELFFLGMEIRLSLDQTSLSYAFVIGLDHCRFFLFSFAATSYLHDWSLVIWQDFVFVW